MLLGGLTISFLQLYETRFYSAYCNLDLFICCAPIRVILLNTVNSHVFVLQTTEHEFT